MTTFQCLRADCGHKWDKEADEDGLFDGFSNALCPRCGDPGTRAEDVHEWHCPEGHTWRGGSNGGLVLGTVPRCPQHDVLPVNA